MLLNWVAFKDQIGISNFFGDLEYRIIHSNIVGLENIDNETHQNYSHVCKYYTIPYLQWEFSTIAFYFFIGYDY